VAVYQVLVSRAEILRCNHKGLPAPTSSASEKYKGQEKKVFTNFVQEVLLRSGFRVTPLRDQSTLLLILSLNSKSGKSKFHIPHTDRNTLSGSSCFQATDFFMKGEVSEFSLYPR
jgi:hypothetical protein